jgi:hypothetical protein
MDKQIWVCETLALVMDEHTFRRDKFLGTTQVPVGEFVNKSMAINASILSVLLSVPIVIPFC